MLVDAQLEAAVVGAVIDQATEYPDDAGTFARIEQAILNLPSTALTDPFVRRVFGVAKGLVLRGLPPARFEVAQALPDPNDRKALAGLLGSELTVLQPHVEKLTELSRRRALNAVAQEINVGLASGESTDELLSRANLSLTTGMPNVAAPKGLGEYGSVLDYFDALNAGRIPVLSTGIDDLDRRLGGGILPGSYVGFCAPTGTGKTRSALHLTRHWSHQGRGGLYISGEMKGTGGPVDVRTHRLKTSLVPLEAEIPSRDLGRGTAFSDATRRRIQEAEQRVNAWPLTVYDQDMSWSNIQSLVRGVARDGGEYVIIDNFNHVAAGYSNGRSRLEGWEKLRECSEALADLFHHTGVTGVVLFQAKVQTGDLDRPPYLSEFADYTGVTRPLDIAISAYRNKRDEHATTGLWSIEKVREGGGGGVVEVGWNNAHAMWHDKRRPLR